ncbi:ABC transporter ATP-binding protein, partial [Micrococcus sp. SIMBA_131]
RRVELEAPRCTWPVPPLWPVWPFAHLPHGDPPGGSDAAAGTAGWPGTAGGDVLLTGATVGVPGGRGQPMGAALGAAGRVVRTGP